MAESVVQFRLIRADDIPATNPGASAYIFGLQDTKNHLSAGVRDAEERWVFNFNLKVKPAKSGAPNFTGPYASGPADDRFVYLSWVSVPAGAYINRLKCRLGDIDWNLINTSLTSGRVIVGDVSGRGPRQAMQSVGWTCV